MELKRQLLVRQLAGLAGSILVAQTMAFSTWASAEPSSGIKAEVERLMGEKTTQDFWRLYGEVRSSTSKAQGQLANYGGLPETSLRDSIPYLTYSRRKMRANFVGGMESASELLSQSVLVGLKVKIDEVQVHMRDLVKQQHEYELTLKQTASAKDSYGWDGWKYSSAEKGLANNRSEQAQAKEDLNFLIFTLQSKLKGYGFKANDSQLNALLVTATAQEDMKLISSFESVRELVRLIQTELKKEPDAEQSREYFGMYALMIASLIQVHDQQLDKINNVYLRKLDELITAAKNNIEGASQYDQDAQQKRNIQTNQASIKTATAYANFLRDKAGKVQASRNNLDDTFKRVLNSYASMAVAADLIETVKNSQEAFDSFAKTDPLNIPPLLDLSNAATLQEFERITQKIQ